jgi:RimJ/RimL family protein N-acetyltransferase
MIVDDTVDGVAAVHDSSMTIGDVIKLDDGTEAIVRSICPSDAEDLLRFHALLSTRSVKFRYFYPHMELRPDEVAHLTDVDGVDRVALVVEHAGKLIAVGRYDRLDDPRTAEVAFVVADAYQHHGLGPRLLERLANAARSVGITRFVAEVLAENRAMLSVFRAAGFPIESKTEWGTVELTMTIATACEPAPTAQMGTRQSSRVPPSWPA